MKSTSIVGAMALFLIATACSQADNTTRKTATDKQAVTENAETTDYRQIPLQTIDGDTTSLAAFKGKVVLAVNVASKCGYTPQYEGLQELYSTYGDSGLVVVGIPANNFGGQEPGTNEEILDFCTSRYSVNFPMMAKISVKGDNQHPLYTYLTRESPYSGEIKWNFTKFLFDRQGQVVARFEPKTAPTDPAVVDKVKELL